MPGSVSRSIAAARAFSRPKRVGSRPKSWLDSAQAAPAWRVRGLDRAAQLLRVPRRVQQLEGEHGVEVVAVGLPPRAGQVDLAHQKGVARRLADPGQRGPGVGGVARVGERELCLVLAQRQPVGLGGGRIVPQLGVLEQPVDRIHPVAGGAALEPEANHVLHRGDHLGVAPVEVGLLGVEGVEVVARGARSSRLGRLRSVGVRSRPNRRRPTTSCWGRRPRCTSRGARGTRDARSRCGRARCPSALRGPARAPRPPARRSRRSCRTPDRCRCSRTRRSRSRPSARDRSATSRARRPPARPDGRGASVSRPGRRSRRRRSPGTSAGRSGRRRRSRVACGDRGYWTPRRHGRPGPQRRRGAQGAPARVGGTRVGAS